jgi:hypothetical protein
LRRKPLFRRGVLVALAPNCCEGPDSTRLKTTIKPQHCRTHLFSGNRYFGPRFIILFHIAFVVSSVLWNGFGVSEQPEKQYVTNSVPPCNLFWILLFSISSSMHTLRSCVNICIPWSSYLFNCISASIFFTDHSKVTLVTSIARLPFNVSDIFHNSTSQNETSLNDFSNYYVMYLNKA